MDVSRLYKWATIIFVCISVMLFAYFYYYLVFDAKGRQLVIEKIFLNSEKIKDIATRIETVSKTPLDEKRNSLLNTVAISFHFVNKNEVENFYNDYFKEPLIEGLVSEVTNELRVSPETKPL